MGQLLGQTFRRLHGLLRGFLLKMEDEGRIAVSLNFQPSALKNSASVSGISIPG